MEQCQLRHLHLHRLLHRYRCRHHLACVIIGFLPHFLLIGKVVYYGCTQIMDAFPSSSSNSRGLHADNRLVQEVSLPKWSDRSLRV